MDASLIPTLCHVGITLDPERTINSSISYVEGLSARYLNDLKQFPTKDWHTAFNGIRIVKTAQIRGGAIAEAFFADSKTLKPPTRSRLESFDSARDHLLLTRGARLYSLEYRPGEKYPPLAFLWPCGLYKWGFFDAFRRHYRNFPDVRQRLRAESLLVDSGARNSLCSVGYAVWLQRRMAGLEKANSVLSEQIEWNLSRSRIGVVGDIDYPYCPGGLRPFL